MHEEAIQDFQVAPDGTYGITASQDKTAKLIDLESFEVLKTYQTGRMVNSAAISPIFDHVSALVGALCTQTVGGGGKRGPCVCCCLEALPWRSACADAWWWWWCGHCRSSAEVARTPPK